MYRIWGVGVGVCRIEGGRLPKLRIRGLRLNASDLGVNYLGICSQICTRIACFGGGLAKRYLEVHGQVLLQVVHCRVRDAKDRGGFLMLLLLLLWLLL